jgi:hypothetical protein
MSSVPSTPNRYFRVETIESNGVIRPLYTPVNPLVSRVDNEDFNHTSSPTVYGTDDASISNTSIFTNDTNHGTIGGENKTYSIQETN